MAATTLGRFVRPEIQALRAVAVLLVLVYHLWPDTLRGGSSASMSSSRSRAT